MSRLRLTAISIDEVRDIFGASPEFAEELRSLATDQFAPPSNRRRGFIAGLFRRDPIVEASPHTPTMTDLESLLAGRYVAPERTDASWVLVDGWLRRLGWAQLELNLSEGELNELEFDLARAGLSSQFAVRKLLAGEAQLPLRPPAGVRVGYAKFGHVVATRDAVRRALPELAETHHQALNRLVAFLDGFEAWEQAAMNAGRPRPDLFGQWTEGA